MFFSSDCYPKHDKNNIVLINFVIFYLVFSELILTAGAIKTIKTIVSHN